MDHVRAAALSLALLLSSSVAYAETCSNDPYVTGRWVSDVATQACASNGVTGALVCGAQTYLSLNYPDFQIASWGVPYKAGGGPCVAGQVCYALYDAHRYGENGEITGTLNDKRASAYFVSLDEVCPGAPPPDTEKICVEHELGTRLQGTVPGVVAPGDFVCLDGCEVRVELGVMTKDQELDAFIWHGTSTGEDCVAGESGGPGDLYQPDPGYIPTITCIRVENQDVLCLDSNDPEDPVITIGPTQLPIPGPDECTTADGVALCGDQAGVPPRPDNGTPGEAAAADGTLTIADGSGPGGRDLDLYDRGTVSGSSTGTSGMLGDGDSAAGAEGDGDGSGPGDGYGTGTASGGETCDAPPNCDHDDPVQCSQLVQAWRVACPTAPVPADLLDIIGFSADERGDAPGPNDAVFPMGQLGSSFSISSDGCPQAQPVSFRGKSFSIQKFWDAACEGAGWLGYIVQAAGVLIAAGVLFRMNWG